MTRDEQIAALYDTHARRSRNLAFLLTGDQALAEDLVQDCFLRLCSRVRPVSQDELPAYLRTMVINASRSHFRRLAVRRRRAGAEAAVLGSDADITPDWAQSRPDTVALRAALMELPPRQRTAVVLRHWLELSEQETAAQMNCSIGTVKSLTSHGRAALRTRLTAMDIEEWSR
jgi:RNA polymerase sigma factor (sigma-70 family)